MSRRDIEQRFRLIRQAKDSIQPEAAWVQRTRTVLRMQVQNAMPMEPASTEEKLRLFARAFLPAEVVRVLRGPMLAALSVIGLVTGGSIAGVSAAEKSVPGDFLYQVKLANEQTQILFTKGKRDKLKLKANFIARRGEEIKEIVGTDISKKEERIKQATDILKRDLDTVKTQLNEVKNEESDQHAAEVAKVVDQKSSELVIALKSVKANLSDESRPSVIEVESAAVTAGVKAVQVLIDTKDSPGAEQVVTKEEIIDSITKMQVGMQETVKDATEKLLSATASTTLIAMPSAATNQLSLTSVSTTLATVTGTASEVLVQSLNQIQSAQTSLTQTKQLIQDDQLSLASDKLIEAAKAVVVVEKAVEPVIAASTTTPVIVPTVSTGTSSAPSLSTPIVTTTESGVTSSTGSVSTVSSTQK